MNVALPQARSPLGFVMVNGQRLPVEINMEWMQALSNLVNRTGGVLGVNDQGVDVFAAGEGVGSVIPLTDIAAGGSNDALPAEYALCQQSTHSDVIYPDIVQPLNGNQADIVTFKAGSAAVPGLSVDADPNTGIYSPASDVLALTAGGTEHIRFSAGVSEISGHLKVYGVTSSNATGSGNLVFGTSPALVSPNLGTPTALIGTNITGTAAGLTAGALVAGSGVTGTKTPPTSVTVTNGLVTAWT